MNILVACEESQAVTKELRARGNNAFSCDIQECSGGHPEWHINMDVLKLINGSKSYGADVYSVFKTSDGVIHELPYTWDLIIAFPPCTHLAVSGARHFEKKREDGRQLEAIQFFNAFLKADCDKIAIENPVNIIGGDYIKQWFPEYSDMPNCTQKIQPYEYGHKVKKTTCLWLKNLKELVPTDIVNPEDDFIYTNGKHYPNWMMETLKKCKTAEERSRARSKTFPGIAKAMAEQWG